MMRPDYSLFSRWTLVAWATVRILVLGTVGIYVGCNTPTETIPVLPSSGTTDAIESDVSMEPVGVSNEVHLEQADYDQLQATIGEFSGRVVVVDIWSTSCAPCMQEFPHLVELAKRYSDQVACISMNVDYIGLSSKPAESYLPRIKAFLAKHCTPGDPTVITHLAASETDAIILKNFGVESIPAILVYDRAGQLAKQFTDANSSGVGLSYKNDVVPVVADLVSGKP